MNEEIIDKITKSILANSNLSLTNPEFNRLALDKLKMANKKQVIVHNISIFCLVFVTFDLLIFSLFKLLGVRILDIIKSITINPYMVNSTGFVFVYFITLIFIAIVMNLISNNISLRH
jgi:hypothetical protein